MAVNNQVITDKYAIYEGDCCEVMPMLPDASVGLSIYSPPFGGLYCYSSSDNDLSNCMDYDAFMAHYAFVVSEIARVTMPGRLSCVHVMDVPHNGGLRDFPGDVIRLHEAHGFIYHDRHSIWKEPLKTAIRTRSKALMHRQIVEDSSLCRSALADYLIVFRKRGENPEPIAHPIGLTEYAGSKPIPEDLLKKYGNGWPDQKTNKLSHIIWQRYASAFWDDIRINRVLPFRDGKDPDDEKHVHPLQLDVIDRCLALWSNPGDKVLTPFMGVGSEVYGAVKAGRKGIGVELKASYFKQAMRNLALADFESKMVTKQVALEFSDDEEVSWDDAEEGEEDAFA